MSSAIGCNLCVADGECEQYKFHTPHIFTTRAFHKCVSYTMAQGRAHCPLLRVPKIESLLWNTMQSHLTQMLAPLPQPVHEQSLQPHSAQQVGSFGSSCKKKSAIHIINNAVIPDKDSPSTSTTRSCGRLAEQSAPGSDTANASTRPTTF